MANGPDTNPGCGTRVLGFSIPRRDDDKRPAQGATLVALLTGLGKVSLLAPVGVRERRMKQAYYAATISEFLKAMPQTILGHLAAQHAHDLDPLQRNAWIEQITLLQQELGPIGDGWIALEFAIPRMGKRVDAIMIHQGIVFVVEFKMGTQRYDAGAVDQVMDYAIDLKNFHAGSHTRRLVPILVATKADHVRLDLEWSPDGVAMPLLSNEGSLGSALSKVAAATAKQDAFDPRQRAASGYKPTPTIIEAAQALYQGHRVEEITRSDAGAKNLSETTTCLEKIIEDAKANRHKTICFVTGVPGAGKPWRASTSSPIAPKLTKRNTRSSSQAMAHWSTCSAKRSRATNKLKPKNSAR